ncbi:bifunctional phosphoribosylaminoimidazolecarboxamide formyltransferase/IMP cyclohydrolase [Chloroflexota bacterium]
MRAILSVSDKTGIDLLGQGLAELGFDVYSTGGTRRALQSAGVPVRPVSDLTGYPEILDGRVKTLHPAVHGGILARRGIPADLDELTRHGLDLIDLVAVNLYPFEETISRSGATTAEALEQIDIGGPSMLRAAAKNHPAVLPLCDPADYAAALTALRQPDGPGLSFRTSLAGKAFRHTAVYDALIAAYLGSGEKSWPSEVPLGLHKVQKLRYGENPQQGAAVYAIVRPGQGSSGLTAAQQLQGKPLSYNNYLDGDAAWAVACDFEPVTAAIIKHTNPCGLARAGNSLAAYELALAGDPLAAFGGIVALNAPVDGDLARRIVEHFFEIVLAPDFTEEALDIMAARPNLRVLRLSPGRVSGLTWRGIAGGMLIQEADRLDDSEVDQGRVVTRRTPKDEEWMALRFAWRAARHVKSNAIVLARVEPGDSGSALSLVGMGAGQPSRVASVEIAARSAGDRARGAVLASDAFFPKADGVEAAARAGVQAVVQPGGSRGEVIAAADAASVAMVFTGARHFLH